MANYFLRYTIVLSQPNLAKYAYVRETDVFKCV
jgi:hypothetical protein